MAENLTDFCWVPHWRSQEKGNGEGNMLNKTDSICFLQNNKNGPTEDCYSEKIRLSVDGIKNYKDTVFNFRNYIMGNDLRRIVCNEWIIDKELDELICESEYFAGWQLETMIKANYFAFILYNTDNQSNIIVKCFRCNRESMEAFEMKRFLVKNKMIIGIMITPGIDEDFMSIYEYENIQWIHTPPQMLNQ